MTVSDQLPLRCWAEVDLSALERNIQSIRSILPHGHRYISVIKADAYGHGLKPVAKWVMRTGADMLAVANIAEAAEIRAINADWPLLLLSPVLPEEDRHLDEYRTEVTLSSLDEVRRFDAVGRAAGRPQPVHMKIDTGMGRTGIWHSQARELYEALRSASGIRLAGVCTHFASAEDDLEFTSKQRSLFRDTLASFSGLEFQRLMIHADNSAGLKSTPAGAVFNTVRVGLLQFGIPPSANPVYERMRLTPVFSLHTKVVLVKRLPAGTSISYGRTHVLQRDSVVAVVAAGYGDGFPWSASNRAQVLINGIRCPVLGRVTMDQAIIDITDIENTIGPGSHVVLVGTQGEESISLSEFSTGAGTIPWEALCSVTERVARLYAPDPIPLSCETDSVLS